MKVLGVMSGDALTAPVAATTRAVAALLGATPAVLHVRVAGQETAARRAAAHAGLSFRSCEGPLPAGVTAAADAPDVAAVVFGSADLPAAMTLETVAGVEKPVVVVPDGGRASAFRRILVPLEGAGATCDALGGVLASARSRAIDVTAVHVLRTDALPAFEEQPGHEVTAWTREFMSRSAPEEIAACPIELHVGTPGPQLATAVAGTGADLVLLCWSGRLGPGRATVIRSTLANAVAPVMLLRASVEAPRHLAGDCG